MNRNNNQIGPVLNMPGEGSRYISIYGDITMTIPELVSSHYVPLRISQIMQRQLDVIGARDEVFDFWWNHAFITSTVIVYHPDKKIKIVTNSDLVTKIHTGNVSEGDKVLPYTRTGRGFAFPINEYDKLVGKEFSSRDCFGVAIQHDDSFVLNSTTSNFYIINSPTIKYGNMDKGYINKLIENPVWLALAEDKELLKEYVDLSFKYFERKSNERKFKGDIHIINVDGKDTEKSIIYPFEFWANEMIAVGMNYDVCRINYGAVVSRKRVVAEKRIVGEPVPGYSPSDSNPKYRRTLSEKINERRNRHDRFDITKL